MIGMALPWLDKLQPIEYTIRHMTPKDSDTKLFQKRPNLGSKPKHDTQHSENTRKQRKK